MLDFISLSRKRTFKSYFYGVIAVCIVIFSGCKEDLIPKDGIVITGKIINPRVPYALLKNYDGISDTLVLDKKGVFSKKMNAIEPGLYSFIHNQEYQSIFIGTGDTLRLRLNTTAFDESLAFSGDSSSENNFLINLFIDIEKVENDFRPNYRHEPHRFKRIVDSLTQSRSEKLHTAAEEQDFDPDFIQKAQEIINFIGWSKLERYPYTHFGKEEFLKSDVLPSNFYAHRHQLNLKDAKLLNNYAFRSYINSFVSNIAFNTCAREQGSGKLIDPQSLKYRKEKLHVMDSLLLNNEVKVAFAGREVRNFISMNQNESEINVMVDEFLRMSNNVPLNDEITKMAATYVNLHPGNKLPDFELYSLNDELTHLSNQVNGLSVLFYWSTFNEAYALKVHKKVNELRIKYPDINFIGINLNNPETTEWKDARNKLGFNKYSEFQLVDNQSVNKQLALRNENRIMVITNDLIILDPNINLFHYKIETKLLGYVSR